MDNNNSSSSQHSDNNGNSVATEKKPTVIRVGICAMDKKTRAKPMQAILKLLANVPNADETEDYKFDLNIFGNDIILHKPVSQWPECDCFIAFFSGGFPLAKAIRYIETRKHRTFSVNDLVAQRWLLDRRTVYKILQLHNIPTPPHIIVSKDGMPSTLPKTEVKADSIFTRLRSVSISDDLATSPKKHISSSVPIPVPQQANNSTKRSFFLQKPHSTSSGSVSPIPSMKAVLLEDLVAKLEDHEGSLKYASKSEPNLSKDMQIEQQTIHSPKLAIQELNDACILEPEVIESKDALCINGHVIEKPFVEKPVDAENHNVYLYFHSKERGGSKRLFRKVGNKSSQDYPDVCNVRDGSFIYEKFVNTTAPIGNKVQQRDTKVYAVGKDFVYAEVRKSPTVDGIVEREDDGKEVRQAISLSEYEKAIGKEVVRAFRQRVCGFDLLQSDSGQVYVCDVNGWSFVKKNKQYYKDCAKYLRKMFTTYMTSRALEQPILPSPANANSRLIGIVGLFRHADRTPKQKVKLNTTDPRLIAFIPKSRKQAKFKSTSHPKQIKQLLEQICCIIDEKTELGTDDTATIEKLSIIRDVLKNCYPGTKIQLKPLRVEENVVTKALLICKWGGMITNSGRVQAYKCGKYLREQILQVSEEEDLSDSTLVFSNNERRVLMTAKLVAAGLLNHKMNESNFLVQDNKLTNYLLGDQSRIADDCDLMKKRVFALMHREEKDNVVREHLKGSNLRYLRELADNGNNTSPFLTLLKDVVVILHCLCARIEKIVSGKLIVTKEKTPLTLSGEESIIMALARWKRLTSNFYDEETGTYDTSKVPDVYDYVKFDILHNPNLVGDIGGHLYDSIKPLADFVVPAEYGISAADKLYISKKQCKPLALNILEHVESMTAMCEVEDAVESVLFFCSESTIQPFKNLVIKSGVQVNSSWKHYPQLNYLSHVILKVYERPNASSQADKFYIKLMFSPGEIEDLYALDEDAGMRALPLVPAVELHPNLSLQQVESILKFITPSSEALNEENELSI